MSGLDRMFLNVESPDLPMDNVGIFVLDPTTAPDRHDFARVRAELATRLPRLPVFTRRPVSVPFAAGRERWAVDPDFDIDRHLFRAGCPEPRDLDALCGLAGTLLATPLARDRPLWQMWYVDGLLDGEAALLMRVHHAVLDGVGGMEMLMRLFDDAPLPWDGVTEPTPVAGERVPGGIEMLVRSLPDQVAAPLRLAASTADVVAPVVRDALGKALTGGDSSPRPAPSARDDADRPIAERSAVPRTVFNRPAASGARSLALTSVSLDDVVAVKRAFDVTLNDVVLAIVSASVNDYLASLDDLPAAPLRVACPVNVRDETDQDGGNQFVFMLVPIATNATDPADHLTRIAAATAARRPARRPRPSGPSAHEPDEKPRRRPSGLGKAMNVVDALPSGLWYAIGQVARTPLLTRTPPIANYVVSNIPGPTQTLYFAGARVSHLYGRTMAGAGVGLFVYCISYAGQLDFGMTALADLVPDPDVLADGVRRHLGLLNDAARMR